MRVAYLISQYPATSHTFIQREIDALRARGFEIVTLSIRSPAIEERASQRDDAAFANTFYVLPPSLLGFLLAHLKALMRRPLRYAATLRLALSHRPPGARALAWALFHFAESIVVADVLNRRKVERLHNHFANSAATVGMLAARYAGVGWSISLHGISETDYPAGLLLGRKIAKADFASCASWFIRAQAMRVTPSAAWQKLILVRCGVDLSALPRSSVATGGTNLVCVGRLSAEKGQAGLLQALAIIRTTGSDAHLTIVGSGPDEAMLRAQSSALGLDGAVNFTGRLDETATLKCIAGAHALILPSFIEGLPVVLMEAMALGVPVIASHVAGIPELIEDNVEGLLFRPGDWDDLSNRIHRLLGDAELRRRLASTARLRIEREFDINKAVKPLAARFLVGENRNPYEAGDVVVR